MIIYASDLWNTSSVTSGGDKGVLGNCKKLVGGQGTTFSSSHVDYDYARIDGGAAALGYFMYKECSSVDAVKTDAVDGGAGYSLDGIRITGQPARKDIYEKNGCKVVVK